MKSILIIVLSLFSVSSFAINEQQYSNEFYQQAIPYFESGTTGQFEGEKGLRINYYVNKVANEKGAIVILTGKSESYIKYAELIYDLKDLGYSFYIMDHRGMGFSERIDSSDSTKVYVKRFKYYVNDAKRFVDQVVKPSTHNQMILLTHSMGGAVGMWFLEEYPEVFDKAIFSSPMLTVHTGSYPGFVASMLANVLVAVGQGKKYAPGQGPWQQGVFEDTRTSTSFVRWTRWEIELLLDFPELQSSGVANRWIAQSLNKTPGIVRRAKKIEIPIMMFQSGKDLYAKPRGQNKACERAKNCQLIRFDDSLHEILMERDEIRDVALSNIISFLD